VDEWPVLVPWVALGGVLVVYLLAFAARQDVSLRPGRLAMLTAAGGVARLLVVALGYRVVWPVDGGLMIAVLACTVALAAARRFWLVRATAQELREQVQAVCGGLFVAVAEPAVGRLVVTAKGQEHRLRLVALAKRLQGLVLCPRPAAGKVKLLVDWLAKQYPGPIPRIRITLKGGEP
jgi:hypothetical protein